MKLIKKIWAWLDGKKRTIACVYWSAWVPAVAIVWPTTVPHKIAIISGLAGLVFSLLGLGHAAIKKLYPTDIPAEGIDK